MLPTQHNTATMEKRILRAGHKVLSNHLSATFEHGHWWVTDTENGAQWDVVDAEGPGSIDGFDFEQVTEADYQ